MAIIRRKIVDGQPERQFLIGMVVSTEFLTSALSFYDPALIDARFVRRVASLCVDYHAKYGKAPGPHIKHLFEDEAGNMEPSEKELIQDLLASLSDQYERAGQLNVPYMLDQAEKLFKLRSLERLGRVINGYVSGGNVVEAERALSEYRLVGRPSSLGDNPFRSVDDVAEAFEREEEGLFTLPGRLGEMLNRELNRDRFLAIWGREKIGKTWWLNEIAIRAAKARCNVALFQLGDMSKNQTIVRISERLCGKSHLRECCGEMEVPVPDCLLGQCGKCVRHCQESKPLGDGEFKPDMIHGLFLSRKHHNYVPCVECVDEKFFKGSLWYRKQTIDNPLQWREAWKVGKRFLCRTKGRDFRLSVHAADELSVSGIKTILNNWETFNEFVPDVIVIDYADNLAPEDRREEYRHQQNRTWKLLRGLSQERHCLVVTATQVNAKAYDQKTLSMKNFSENKLKLAHPTATIGLNQSEEEKQAGLMRINMIIQREGAFFSNEVATVAQCLSAGKPLLFSF